MASIPTPHTYTVGEIVTASTMNGVRDALRFLIGGAATYKPSMRAYMLTTGQSIPNNTATAIKFNTKLEATDTAYSTSTGIYTVVTAGLYIVTYAAAFASLSAGVADYWITATSAGATGRSTPITAASDSFARAQGSSIIRAAVNDTISVQVIQTSGGSSTTNVGLGSAGSPGVYFALDWISA